MVDSKHILLNSIQHITSRQCKHCLEKDLSEPCIRVAFSDEYEFDNFYRRVRVLTGYLKTNESIQPLLDSYRNLDKEDSGKLDCWTCELYNFWEENFLSGDIDEMLVYDDVGNVIGFKVIYSKLYEEDPFYVPKESFENLLRFNDLYLQYIKSRTIKLLPELHLISNINFN